MISFFTSLRCLGIYLSEKGKEKENSQLQTKITRQLEQLAADRHLLMVEHRHLEDTSFRFDDVSN